MIKNLMLSTYALDLVLIVLLLVLHSLNSGLDAFPKLKPVYAFGTVLIFMVTPAITAIYLLHIIWR